VSSIELISYVNICEVMLGSEIQWFQVNYEKRPTNNRKFQTQQSQIVISRSISEETKY